MITNKIVHEKTNFNPISNTGLNLTQSVVKFLNECASKQVAERGLGEATNCIDWMTYNGEIREEQFNQLERLLLRGKLWQMPAKYSLVDNDTRKSYGGFAPAKIAKSENGVVMGYTLLRSGQYRVIVMLNGNTMSRLYPENCGIAYAQLADIFEECGLHPSRIDNTISDPTKTLDIPRMYYAITQNNLTGARTHTFIDSGKNGKTTGRTLYIGSRQSASSVRIYDMYYKHGIIGNRIENELHDKKAQFLHSFLIGHYKRFKVLLEQLLKSHKQATRVIYSFTTMLQKGLSVLHDNTDETAKLIREVNHEINWQLRRMCLGAFDFVDKTKRPKNGSIKDCPRLLFWQKILDTFLNGECPIKIKVSTIPPTLKKTAKWLLKSVKGTIDLIHSGLPLNDFISLINVLNLESKDANRPNVVEQDREIKKAQLESEGIYALLTQEQLEEFRRKYGTIFDTATYEDDDNCIVQDCPVQSRTDGRTPFFDYIYHDGEWVKSIYEKFPLVFEGMCKHITLFEREMLELYCNNWREKQPDRNRQVAHKNARYI